MEKEIPSCSGGVKPFPIQGILGRERDRLAGKGMSAAERKLRAQWVKDQVLAPHEPVYVPEIEQELLNPIRRLYRKPLDIIFKAMEPTMGKPAASVSRYLAGKLLIGFASIYAGIYYFKYNKNDWTREGGWRAITGRPRVLPGEPGYPFTSELKPQDFGTHGFENSPI